MIETLADRLVKFALETRFDDLPDVVIAEAKRRLVDAFGCAAGALHEHAPTDRAAGGGARSGASRARP